MHVIQGVYMHHCFRPNTVQVVVGDTYHHTTTRVQVEYLHHTHHHARAGGVQAIVGRSSRAPAHMQAWVHHVESRSLLASYREGAIVRIAEQIHAIALMPFL